MPRCLAVTADLLFVGGGDELRVFDRHSGELLLRTGRRGSGPGEYQWLHHLQLYQDRSGRETLWAYDWKLGRLTGFAIADGKVAPLDSVVMGLAGYESVSWVDDTTLVGVPLFSPYRIALLNDDGKVREQFGDLPFVHEGAPVTVAQQILQPKAVVRPNKTDFIAVAARYAGRLDIYPFTPKRAPLSASVPVPFSPVISYRDNGAMYVFNTGDQTIFAYLSVAATGDNIYALFSGRTRAGFKGRETYGNQIHVFGWTGELVGAFSLDHDALAIAVTADGTRLYAIAPEPEPRITEYNLAVMPLIRRHREPGKGPTGDD
jgi:hypothetical protein